MRTVALLCLLLSTAASAQTYVRPSKGKALTIFGAQTFANGSSGVTSAVYDWTAFESVQVILQHGSTCYYTLDVVGATSATGTFSTTLVPDANASSTYTSSSTTTNTRVYNVSQLPPYLKFQIRPPSGATFGAATCSGSTATNSFTSLTVIPIPFTPRYEASGSVVANTVPTGPSYPVIVGGVDPSGRVQTLNLDSNSYIVRGAYPNIANTFVSGVNSASQTVALPAPTVDQTYQRAEVFIQNVGTVTAYCKFDSATSPATTSDFSFVLAGGLAPHDGKGKSITLHGAPYIGCVTAAGTTTLLVNRYY